MIDNSKSTDQLWKEILAGIQKATKKMVIIAAANNESLVIGNKDGTCQLIPAKKLLKTLTKK